jgi:hypothetical protein
MNKKLKIVGELMNNSSAWANNWLGRDHATKKNSTDDSKK